ncbi:MAG: hypothetical protein K1X92_19025 [Bacteroidia bacterium]|nr:hypothetical protein [Bacteroidia bacterium]
MKSIIGLILLLFLISCRAKQEPKSAEVNLKSVQLDKTITNQDSLFILQVNLSENFVRIIPPEISYFELPDNSVKTEPFRYGDFNADGREDILVYMGACGTGGCMYGLFLNQYDNYFKLAFFDYLKNAEFKVEKNGLWTIQSSEELEPYNPYKLQISIFKFNKDKYKYEMDSAFVYLDKEGEKVMDE